MVTKDVIPFGMVYGERAKLMGFNLVGLRRLGVGNKHIKELSDKVDAKKYTYKFNMQDMARKEILNEDMLFTKWGWIYQYNSIPNNKEDQLTLYWMKKTYEYLYG
mgnify:CR=1 FL=1